MSQARGGLGRGLDALIPRSGSAVQEVDVDRVVPNPSQPRQAFDPSALDELADSIRRHGVLQPIVVSHRDGSFVLITGERRWRAARIAGLATIPAVIRETSPANSLEIALVENVQRADLTALEEAAAYRSLMVDHGLSQAEVADRVSRSRSAVANRLRLLSLPPITRGLLAEGLLTEGHARALLGCDDAVLLDRLAERVTQSQLSVRQTEELVRRHSRGPGDGDPLAHPGPTAESVSARRDPELTALEDDLRQALGTRVQLVRSRRGGRVIIHYYDDEQLTGLIETILGRGEL